MPPPEQEPLARPAPRRSLRGILLAGLCLTAALVALARVATYKEALPHERAAAIIADGRGTHFDPDVVDAFLGNQERFSAIAARFADAVRAAPAA